MTGKPDPEGRDQEFGPNWKEHFPQKTQPQKLLEEIIPHENEDEKYPSDPEPMVVPEDNLAFPSVAEQQAHWDEKEKATKPPRKWTLARHKKFRATMERKKMEREKPDYANFPLYDYPPSKGQIKPWDKLKTPPVLREKKHICSHTECGKGFYTAGGLRVHARVHATKQIAALPQNPTGFREVTGRPVETLDTHRKKWSLARRRAYNRKKKQELMAHTPVMAPNWHEIPPPPQETVPAIKFCPHCGGDIQRFLA